MWHTGCLRHPGTALSPKSQMLKLHKFYEMASGLSCRVFCRGITLTVTGPWNYVAGKRCDPIDSLGFMKVTEPATGQVMCEVPISGPTEVDRAVASAKNVFSTWSKLSGRERGQKLLEAGRIIRENLENISSLEVRDTGKPIWEARVDIASCADALEYYGGLAPAIVGQYVPLNGGSFAMVQREPLGVIGGIGAWNFPMQTCVWKAAPALACGNTFVYKPSQFTPITAVTLSEVLTQAGVPPGVFNVIQGEGEAGAKLCEHPDVAKLSFTGSVSTGTKVMAAGAKGIKSVTLELGGKSPIIIFEDADMKNAVKATLMANFLSQGQVCSNGTRVFVHRSIASEFIKQLVGATEKLKIGDPFAEDTTVGATIHEDHAKKVLSYIASARKEGATILCGGERVMQQGKLAGGWYLSPSVIGNCQDHMKVVKEEVFGSVASVLEFDSEEEVVKRANDTDFGLAGAVFTKDIQRGHRVANAIEAGMVWINTFNLYPTEIPFGGYKHSGIGRENGLTVVDYFTQTRTVYVEMGDVDCGPLYQD
ncbi:4-trimethylaminobutyraldehyde dehydrogenase-like isoform X2 [Homarus americanus]|uniref:4-trimethylaminobutyraldehyde dehydrogenase-like isoform X2 n=1 Tax=Homarus americanus TaxID=6706 RepID=UPI001C46B8A5|nr:4-trimethylaminobutyraldehyde dehydrogenase-like isoform X2 [Homarus americanus]